MAIGYIDKDFFEEGPERAVFHSIALSDPSILDNVKLWLGHLDGHSYYMTDGIQKTIDGETVYEFNFDTRQARRQLSDGSLETKQEDIDDDGTKETVAKYRTLRPGRLYRAEVSYTSTGIASRKAIGAVAEVEIRPALSIVK